MIPHVSHKKTAVTRIFLDSREEEEGQEQEETIYSAVTVIQLIDMDQYDEEASDRWQ